MKIGHLKDLYRKFVFENGRYLKLNVINYDVNSKSCYFQGYLKIGGFLFACNFTHLESPGYMRDIIQNYIR